MQRFTLLIVVQCVLVVQSMAQYNVWTAQQSNTTNYLHGVDFISPFTGWAVGESGTILKSTTGGITWEPQTSGVSNALLDVDFVDSLIGYAVGNDAGIILKTTDGGNNWIVKDNGRIVSAAYFVSTTTGWVVGADGLILKTTDGGDSWTQQVVQDLFSYLTSVYFVNADTGWVGGLIPGVLLTTTDGGSSWVPATSGIDFSEDVNAVSFVNASVGWLAGYGFPDTVGVGIIRKTTDGGKTWSSQTSGVNQPLLSVAFLDTLNGWIVGNGGTILRTTNGGEVWTTETSGVTNGLDKIVVRKNEGGWIAGFDGAIIRNNFGSLLSQSVINVNDGWNIVSLPLTPIDTRKNVLYPTAMSNAFGYATSYYVDDSLDEGVGYWLKFSGNQTVSIIGYPKDSLAIHLVPGWNLVGGISSDVPIGNIIQSPPNSLQSIFQYGLSYTPATIIEHGKGYWMKAIRDCQITLMSTLNVSTSRESLTDIRYLQNDELPPSAPAEVISTNDGKAQRPTEFALHQNYPNPFNPTTRISYDVPEQSTVRMSVFDILGQEVATLVNGVVGAGFQVVEWNAATNNGTVLPSGLYMYRIQATSFVTGKEFSQARKMLLMK